MALLHAGGHPVPGTGKESHFVDSAAEVSVISDESLLLLDHSYSRLDGDSTSGIFEMSESGVKA